MPTNHTSAELQDETWLDLYARERHVIVNERRLNASELADDVASLYLRSVYWASITMTTVGYGDIVPADQGGVEQGVAMLVMLGGLILYLLSAEFTTLISNSSRLEEEFERPSSRRRLSQLQACAARITKARAKLFRHAVAAYEGFSETAVINDLPRSLARRACGIQGLLDRVPLFKGVEDTFVRQLVKLVTLDFYMPDEYIIRKDDVGKEMFFIQRGVYHVLADDKTPLFTLPTGSFFSEIA